MESRYSKRAPLYLQTSITGASYIVNPQSGISERAGAQWGAPGVQTDKRKKAFVIAVQVPSFENAIKQLCWAFIL